MFKIRHTVLPAAILLLVSLLTAPAAALEVTVDPTTQFCFSSDDFTAAEADEGIFITSVPSANIATVYCGERALKAGDALTTEALDTLTLQTDCVTAQTAAVEYCTIADGKVTGIKSLKMSIRPKKNAPPTAEDSSFETYKNIANSGTLKCADPEGKALTYTLVSKPKRGTVELHTDGTFTYTPNKNKVGSDSFEFTVTDEAGNTSEPAKVSIKIKKPTEQETYADMIDDPDLFEAVWLRENGLFSGSTVAGHLCFSPEASVTRGEFLVMAMKLVNADNELTSMTSGFADENASPDWMRPYIAEALSNGMISGTATDNGVVFRAEADMTKAEAAVMLQNILDLPASEATAAFSSAADDIVPAWAADAFSALSVAGIELELSDEDELLTRRTAAKLLYDLSDLVARSKETFFWVK